MDIAVIIVNWNTRELLRKCLESLGTGLGALSHEVWVIDNASTDGSAEMVRADFPNFHLVENRTNAGFAKANNQGISSSEAEHILLLNSDARLTPGAADALVSSMRGNGSVGMAGPRLILPDGSVQPSTYPVPGLVNETFKLLRLHHVFPALAARRLLGGFWDHSHSRSVGFLSGACLLIRRKAFQDVGPLDEDFYFYGEVHDWCWRARKKGWDIRYVAEASVRHDHGQSSEQRWGVFERKRRVGESALRLIKKHRPAPARWAWYFLQFLSASVSLIFSYRLSRQKRSELVWDWVWFLHRLGYSRLVHLYESRFLSLPIVSSVSLLRFVGIGRPGSIGFFKAWEESGTVADTLLRRWAEEKDRTARTGLFGLSAGRLLYTIVRRLAPETVVETGVANGASSTFILSALERNGTGRLHSIDQPVAEDGLTFLPPGKAPGWLVPDSLRARWTLTLGDTHRELPPLLERLTPIDLFLHDSDHSYETMRFEYTAAWRALRPGGWLISDDIGFNALFDEWKRETGAASHTWGGRMGLLRKP
ncbi:MAG TPA: class I SAM-dependent methyltransferase [Elusimicrobiota bacterium]|nr:class I SAM-dependent methyltransferase [Elusimicrobiota bacterium]